MPCGNDCFSETNKEYIKNGCNFFSSNDVYYFNNDFKDNILSNNIKEYLLNEIKETIKFKTLGICLKGIKCNIQKLENGIKINDKVFRLKKDNYSKLKSQLLDYISGLKNNVK